MAEPAAGPLAAFERLGVTVTEVTDDDAGVPRCSFRGCEHNAPLIDSGDGWFCTDHAGDDALPPLAVGVIGACIQCGRGSALLLPDGRPLHPRCRRVWMTARPQGTAPKGAYARRKKG
jgi:hypothetical protein